MKLGNTKGFTTLMILTVIPLLLLSSLAVAAGCLILLKWRQTHELCQRSLIEVQKDAGDGFNELFGLNPTASRLRIEREAAEKALETAGAFPPAAAAASAYLASVIARQFVLRAKQDMIKARIRINGNRKIKNLTQDLTIEQGVDGWPAFTPLRLSIRHAPPNTLTPDYFPLQRFSELQAIKGTWRLSPAFILPRWLSSFLPSLNIVGATCSATLKQEGMLWKPTLGAGRY